MISDLFKSICHDAPKRVIRPIPSHESTRQAQVHESTGQALKRYLAEQEQKRKEIEDIALFARLVHTWRVESRQRQSRQRQ